MKYANKFHNPMVQSSKKVIETDAEPVVYKGYLIFHRIKSNDKGSNVFDVVSDNDCIGMYAGINGAKKFIDNL